MKTFKNFETSPKIIQTILLGFEGGDIEECKKLEKLLVPHGYILEWGLENEPHILKRLSECEIGDWAVITSEAVNDSGYNSNHGMVMGFSRDITTNNTDYNYWVHLNLKSGESATVGVHEINKLY